MKNPVVSAVGGLMLLIIIIESTMIYSHFAQGSHANATQATHLQQTALPVNSSQIPATTTVAQPISTPTPTEAPVVTTETEQGGFSTTPPTPVPAEPLPEVTTVPTPADNQSAPSDQETLAPLQPEEPVYYNLSVPESFP